MDTDDIRTLYEYNTWANRRVVAMARSLNREEFTIMGLLQFSRAWRGGSARVRRPEEPARKIVNRRDRRDRGKGKREEFSACSACSAVKPRICSQL